MKCFCNPGRTIFIVLAQTCPFKPGSHCPKNRKNRGFYDIPTSGILTTSGNTSSQKSQTVGDSYDVIGRIGIISTLKVLTLYNVCAVPWGGAQYRGGVQYRGGYHEYRGGYLEYRGGCSVPWGDIMIKVGDIMSTVGDIMSTVGVILSTVGMFSTVGGYHDARGDIMSTVEGVQYRGGYHPLKFEYRGGTS